MEIVKIVGSRKVDFTDQSGRSVKGTTLYYTSQRDGVLGEVADKFFVSDQRAAMIKMPDIGKEYAVSFDRFGKPTEFEPYV